MAEILRVEGVVTNVSWDINAGYHGDVSSGYVRFEFLGEVQTDKGFAIDRTKTYRIILEEVEKK